MKANSYLKKIIIKYALPLILLTFTITGCAYYTQKGKTTADFDKDKKYCEGIAKRETAQKGTRMCDEIDNCLVNMKGWKRD